MVPDPPLQPLLTHIEAHDRHDPHDPLVRQVVRLRARDACEYCLHPTSGQFEIDHLIPEALWSDYLAGHLAGAFTPIMRRRGPQHLDNFAWSCPFCNLGKRQRITYQLGKTTVRLFDPRHDRWSDHFRFMHNHLFIVGTTPIGVATQRVLGFNAGEIGGPLGTRHDSIMGGRYPPPWVVLPSIDQSP